MKLFRLLTLFAIGANVTLEGAYLMDNIVVQDNAVIKKSIVSNNVIIGALAIIEKGCIIGPDVCHFGAIWLKTL